MHHGVFSRSWGWAVLAPLVFCLVTLVGCLGATRLPVRSRGPSGNRIQPKEITLGFLQPGTTNRQQVLDKLHSINTGSYDPHLFWGRWADSRWGYWWVVVAPSTGRGGGAGAGNAKRLWRLKNILVSFDGNGIVQSVNEFEDDSALWRELHNRLPDLPPLDLAQLISMPLGSAGDSALTLGKDFMEVNRRKKPPSRIAPRDVVRISHEGTPNKSDDVGLTCHTLYFSHKTDAGKKLHLCAHGPQILALFQYLQQTGPKNIKWE